MFEVKVFGKLFIKYNTYTEAEYPMLWLNYILQKGMLKSRSPGPHNMTLFGNRDVEVLIFKVRSYWSRVGPLSHMIDVIIRGEKTQKYTWGEESLVMIEAEIEVPPLQGTDSKSGQSPMGKKQGKIAPYRFQREHGSDNTLISVLFSRIVRQ